MSQALTMPLNERRRRMAAMRRVVAGRIGEMERARGQRERIALGVFFDEFNVRVVFQAFQGDGRHFDAHHGVDGHDLPHDFPAGTPAILALQREIGSGTAVHDGEAEDEYDEYGKWASGQA